MCMQCMAAVATSGAAVTGIRSWLGTRRFAWLTPQMLKRLTIGLVAIGLVASTVAFSGSGQ